MKLLNWYVSKRNSILDKISGKKKNLFTKWRDFKERDTYLTSDLKEQLHKDYSEMFHWFFLLSQKVRTSSRDYKTFLEGFKEELKNHNEEFIERRLKEYNTFFNGKEHNSNSLNSLQRKAIVVDDMHNLVIAGAGAGKTAVLTTKIAYLCKRQDKPKIKPEKILVLAFNNSAVAEIQERIDNKFKIKGVNIKNFHQLGCGVIRDETKSSPSLFEEGKDYKIKNKLKPIISKLLENKDYQNLFLEYLSSYLEEEITIEDFEKKVEYYEYMRNKKYTTLKNEPVNSIAERDIANFFFTHNIEYEYEKEVEWILGNKQDYCPDFYLPKYDIYIEHWGLSRDNKVPDWFEGENPSEKYLNDKKWKLEQFKKYKKKLVESWDYERLEGNLLQNIQESLKKVSKDIKFKKLSYEQIVENTNSYRDNQKEILEMIYSFIIISKGNGVSISEIKERISSKDYTERQKLFGKMAVEVLIEYEKLLKENNKIDFNDMIIQATQLVNKNPKHFKDKYDYILIDEFQDISKPRLNLVKALLNCNSHTKLFCVGDDWQSINGFAGSEVDYVINFNKEFDYCVEIPLRIAYRGSKLIVEMSNQLISNNKNRVEKEVCYDEEGNVIGSKAKVFVLPSSAIEDRTYRINKAKHLIRNLLEKGINPKEILVLSRFNKILRDLKMSCENSTPTIPIEDIDERRKGVKLCSVHKSKGLEAKYVILLDVISGTYGFPSEIEDSSVLEIARNKKNKDTFEEERRLFYVALTRSKEHLFIFTIKKNKSIFLKEISDYTEEAILKEN